MKTVLLVDDEPTIRRHIMEIIPWESWGYAVAGEAGNGAEALELCIGGRPDIALVDLTMPVMGGLELIEALAERCPEIGCVVLTAHREFELARQAMERGAVGYVVKYPLVVDDMKSALARARRHTERVASALRAQTTHDALLRQYHYPLRQKFWDQIATGVLKRHEEIAAAAGSLHVDLHASRYVVMRFRIDNLTGYEASYTEKDRSLIEFSMLEIVRETLQDAHPGFELFPVSFGQFVLLLNDGQREAAAERPARIRRIHADVKRSLETWMNASPVAAVSGPIASLGDLRAVNRQLEALLAHRFYLTTPEPIVADKVRAFQPLPDRQRARIAESWRACLEAPSHARLSSASAWAVKAKETIYYYRPEPDDVLALLRELHAEAVRTAAGEATAATAAGGRSEDDPPAPDYRHTVNLEGAFDAFLSWFERKTTSDASLVQLRAEIAAAVRYIRERLHENLSLETIADAVGLSPSYFGQLFKKEVGQTVIDYILRCRIDAAKRHLLAGTYRNYELAEKLGFSSLSYFCTVFKKETGMTPNEFKNAHRPLTKT